MLDQQTVTILLAVGFTAIVMYLAAKNGKLPGIVRAGAKAVTKKSEQFTAAVQGMSTARPVTPQDIVQLEERLLSRVSEAMSTVQVKKSHPDLPPRPHLDVLHDMVLGAVEEKKATDAKMAAVKSGLSSLGQ